MKQFGIRFQDADATVRADPLPGPEPFDLRRALGVFRRQSRLVALGAAAGVLLGLAYIVTTPPQFFAASRVLVDDRLSKFTEEVAASTATVRDDTAILNQIEVLQSQTLALSVVDRLDLASNDAFLNPPRSGLSRAVGAAKAPLVWLKALLRPAPAAGGAGEGAAEDPRVAAALALAQDIRVSQVGRSYVIEVGYVGHDPALAASIVNTYADVYLADQLNATFNATRRTTEWLQSRLLELQANAQAAANEVEAFKSANGLTDIQGSLVTEQKLSDLNTQLAAAEADVTRAEAVAGQFARFLEGGFDPADLPAIQMTDGAGSVSDRMAAQRERYATLNDQLAAVEARYGPEHPQATALRAERDEAANTIIREVRRRAETARAEVSVARARADALRAQVAQATAQNSEATKAQVRLRELERNAATLQALYQEFSTRRETIALQETFPVSNVRILGTAEVPKDPALPRTVPVMGATLILGLMGGLGLGLWREFRDRGLRTGDDVIDTTGLPFLGYLPAFVAPAPAAPTGAPLFASARKPEAESAQGSQSGPPWSAVLNAPHYFNVLTEPEGPYCETLRNVRLAADLAIGANGARVLGVVSMLPGEGKTTVAANFANLLARAGKRTLLIDADLRRPQLSTTLALSGKGLVHILTGDATPGDAIRLVRETGLHVLPCRRLPDLPLGGDLLQLPTMKALMADLRRAYDYVILDLPPIGPVVDARVLLASMDRVVLVTDWGRTPRDLILQQLRRDPALAMHCLGVVLNNVDLAALSRYAGYDGAETHLVNYSGYYDSR